MARLRPWCTLLACGLALCAPLSAQDADRIWGRVFTAEGEEYEGFIRWDRNEGSWVDILDGSKEVPRENYVAWLDANDDERAVRVIELLGHRVSWDEEHPDFALTSASGIRFGHLASLEVTGRARAELRLRSGQTLEMAGGTTDLGPGLRRILIDVPGESEVGLPWRQLARITFSAAPQGARAASRRLHGTVTDEQGRRFTGYIAWDLDEILESDVLDGEEVDGGEDREIRFGEISVIEKISEGARVTLHRGDVLDLTGTNDVDEDNSGIQISDPALGMIEVEWEEFVSLRLHPRDAAVGYDAFDGGRPLGGTVVTTSGEEISGLIRWDADEQATWEMLSGWSEDTMFTIELGNVERVEKAMAFGAVVTLTDGRKLELDGTRDVDLDNKGIMIAQQHADLTDPASWRVVAWDDFEEIRLWSSR